MEHWDRHLWDPLIEQGTMELAIANEEQRRRNEERRRDAEEAKRLAAAYEPHIAFLRRAYKDWPKLRDGQKDEVLRKLAGWMSYKLDETRVDVLIRAKTTPTLLPQIGEGGKTNLI